MYDNYLQYWLLLFVTFSLVPWIVISEVFPLRVKGKSIMSCDLSFCDSFLHVGIASSAVNSVYTIFEFLFKFLFPLLVGPPLHIHGYVYITGITYFIAILMVWLFIPETKVRIVILATEFTFVHS